MKNHPGDCTAASVAITYHDPDGKPKFGVAHCPLSHTYKCKKCAKPFDVHDDAIKYPFCGNPCPEA